MKVGGLLLAAGRSSRVTGGRHKLLSTFDGIPLVRRSAMTMLASELFPVVVVTGHRSVDIEAALTGLPVVLVNNAEFDKGMNRSLAVGFHDRSLDACDGVVVMLADMPWLSVTDIVALTRTFRSNGGLGVVRASDGQNPGHPVIMPNALFAALRTADGDEGARAIVARSGLPVHKVDVGPPARRDVDTVEAIVAAGGRMDR